MKGELSSLLPDFAQPDGNVSAELSLLGKTYSISEFSTTFDQPTDSVGEPEGEVRGGKLELTLSQLPDDFLLQWAMSRWMRKSGEVIFKNQTGTSPLRISFVEASCVKLRQKTVDGGGAHTALVVSAKEILFNGVLLESGWVE